MARRSGELGRGVVRCPGRLIGVSVLTLGLTLTSCARETSPAQGPRPSDRSSTSPQTSSPRPSPTPAGFEAEVASIRRATAVIIDETLPGVVVLVRHGPDRRVLALGRADVESGTPMTPRHLFRIGSITKSMMAVTVLTLVERGLLSLDDTVDRWLPGLVPRGGAITVEQLLDHSSGLANYTDTPRFATLPRGRPPSPRELVRLGTSEPPLFPPGQGVHYSNTGYLLLGLIVERATHRSLAHNLRSAVFTPARMHSSSFGRPVVATAPVAHGYANGKDVSSFPLGWAWAAGAAVSDAADVAAFFDRLLSGGLLRRELLVRMQDPGEPMPENGYAGYGLGLANVATVCGTAWGHEGQFPGYASAAWTNPQQDRQVVVLANATIDAFDLTFQTVINTALCGAD